MVFCLLATLIYFSGYSVEEHQKVWREEATNVLKNRKEGKMTIELFKEVGAKNVSSLNVFNKAITVSKTHISNFVVYILHDHNNPANNLVPGQ